MKKKIVLQVTTLLFIVNCMMTSLVSAQCNVPSPIITVNNFYNCATGQASLIATNYTGTLHWNNGSTASALLTGQSTTWTLYQTVGTCNSPAVTAATAPNGTPATPVVTVQNSCNGTSVLSTTSAGNLLWSSGATTPSITVTSGGPYFVTATSGSCPASKPGTGIAAPSEIPLPPTVADADNCGYSILSTTATGALSWNTGATTSSITVTSAGAYTVTTTNTSGCTSNPGGGTASPINLPQAPTPSVTAINNCGNSILTAGNYSGSLLWNTGATTSSITVTAGGAYSAAQTLSNGCVSIAGATTASPLSLPSTPVVTVVNNCVNSILSTTATGTLSWSGGGATTASITVNAPGSYSVTQTGLNNCVSASGTGKAAPVAMMSIPAVTVINNCNSTATLTTTATGSLLWSTGATTASINVTAATTYSVTTTSTSGCTSLAGTGAAAPLTAPPSPVIAVNNSYNCAYGQASLIVTGYTGALHWNNGSTASALLTGAAATWTLYQTVGSCNSAAVTAVTAPIATPSKPVVTVKNSCNGTSVLSTTSAGNLLWSSGAITSSITLTSGGPYFVTATSGSCPASKPGTGIAAPSEIPSTPTVTDADNCGYSTLSTTATGALLWITGATTNSITVTSAGAYTVTTTNTSGCTSNPGGGTASPIALPQAPTPSVTDIDNCGNSILIAGNYSGSLLWNTGATTSSITVTSTGAYSVTQTLSNGCISIANRATASPQYLPPTPVITVVNNCANSILSTTATGALLWNTGATAATITIAATGIYSVSQTALDGCTSASGTGTAAPVALSMPQVTAVNGCGTSSLTTTATGSLLWSTQATTSSISVTTAGTYSVTNTSASGCTSLEGTATVSPLTVPPSPAVTVNNSYNCAGTASLIGTSYTGTLHWNNGSSASALLTGAATTWTLYQTVGSCNSAAVTAVTAPVTTPSKPGVITAPNPSPCASSTTTNPGTNYTYSIATVSGATSYIWTVPAGFNYTSLTTAVPSLSVTTTNAVAGNITVKANNNCGPSTASSLPVTFTCRESGTGDEAGSMSMVAYPNPAHNKLNVDFSSLTKGEYVIKMNDITGRLLFERAANAEQGDNHVEFDLDNFAGGIYILSFSSDGESRQQRVVVE